MQAPAETLSAAAAVDNGLLRHFVDGRFIASAAGTSFDNLDPATGRAVGRVCEGGTEEVDAAVAAARAALRGPWGRITAEERGAILHRIAAGIEARFEEFVAAECADSGKPFALARQLDVPRGAANFRAFADIVRNVAAESFRTDTPDGAGALNYTIRRPKGVIAAICPWNLPLLLTTWKVAPALACGNTIIVKPSEETPTTAALLGEVMNAAGVPPGVFNVVHGFGPGAAGELLSRHPDVDAITFTGETVTGAAIMKHAADGLRDVSFELGGKNPGIVFADSNLEAAVEGIARAAFANCGQVCLGTERVYVERSVFDTFLQRLKVTAEGLRPGAPDHPATTLGPMVSKQQRDKVLGYFALAAESGARVVTGGGVPEMPEELAGGFWVQPTIWTGLAEDSPIVREEIFGPCCHLQPFDTEDQAIAMANDTRYGLCSSIWTENSARAHRVAAAVECGVSWVNSWFLRDLRTPFGGAKTSGIGREGGVYSLDFYSELRNVCVKL